MTAMTTTTPTVTLTVDIGNGNSFTLQAELPYDPFQSYFAAFYLETQMQRRVLPQARAILEGLYGEVRAPLNDPNGDRCKPWAQPKDRE